jgi:hypothetical protein
MVGAKRGPVTQVFNINTPDPDTFRRSQRQIIVKAMTQVERERRRREKLRWRVIRDDTPGPILDSDGNTEDETIKLLRDKPNWATRWNRFIEIATKIIGGDDGW